MSPRLRNPRYFPLMKVRGSRRRRLAPMQRLSGSFDGMGSVIAMTSVALASFGLAIKAAVEAERVSAGHQSESQPVSALPAPITHPDRSERPQST